MVKKIHFLGLIVGFVSLVVLANSVYATATTWKMLNLPDTGQTTSYTDTFGEDADYSLNPLSYTDNGDTVTDNVTGLIWQKNEAITTTTVSAAETYCAGLSLGSYSDWRLPTSHELYSLVDLSAGNPPLSADIFTNSVTADYWWSATQRADGSSNYWAVNAGGGIGPKPEDEAQSRNFYVRCVRDELTSAAFPGFTDNGDQTVTEANTGLMWQRDGTTSLTWEAALNQCENLTLADYTDWRLPNIKELRSISDDESLYHPSVSTTYFTLTQTYAQTPTVYWSSTTNQNGTDQAWYVDFYYGLVSHASKTGMGQVLCVRSETSSSAEVYIYLPLIVKLTTTDTAEFTLSSSAVVDGELLDAYKCEEKVNGVEASIPLAWSNVPDTAGSLAVIMHHYPNPDDTSQANSYLLLWDIDPSVTEIGHGEADDGPWFMGANKDGNTVSYTSPCSPSAGVHEYTITLYALSETPPSLPAASTIDVDYDVLKAAIDTVSVIDTAVLTFDDVNE